MTQIRRWGGYASIYEGVAYLIGLITFIGVLGYQNISEPAQKMALVADNLTLLHTLNILVYIFFGIALVVLVIALHKILEPHSHAMMALASVVGFIWSGLVIASGMISNIGMSQAVELYAQNAEQATVFWLTLDTVATAIGGGNEIVGGLWTFLVSLAALRAAVFPRLLNYLGLLVGAAGIVSTIPMINEVAGGIFGLTQVVWFIWLGVVLLRTPVLSVDA